MSKNLFLRQEELFPVFVESEDYHHYKLDVSDEFYERFNRAVAEFHRVQNQLERMVEESETGGGVQ